jgi:hypothetical protein
LRSAAGSGLAASTATMFSFALNPPTLTRSILFMAAVMDSWIFEEVRAKNERIKGRIAA